MGREWTYHTGPLKGVRCHKNADGEIEVQIMLEEDNPAYAIVYATSYKGRRRWWIKGREYSYNRQLDEMMGQAYTTWAEAVYWALGLHLYRGWPGVYPKG